MKKYRRRNTSDTWHFCENCSNWPTKPNSYVVKESVNKPSGKGELCNECQAKQRRDDCRTVEATNLTGNPGF